MRVMGGASNHAPAQPRAPLEGLQLQEHCQLLKAVSQTLCLHSAQP